MSASAPTRRRRRHLGRTLQRTPLADAVGVLLAGDLAPRLLDYFNHYELAAASGVSRRWRTAAVLLTSHRTRELLARPGAPSDVAALGARLDMYNNFLTRQLESSREQEAGQVDDATADHLVQLWVNGLNAHVVEDPGASSAASCVEFVEFLASQNVHGRVLIIAVQDELDKWNAAFRGKAYFCGDLDAQPLPGGARAYPRVGLLVSVCSEGCVRRHSSSVVHHQWKILVVDAGPARASYMCGTFGLARTPLLLAIRPENRYLVSRSRHASGAERIPRGVFARPKRYLLDLEEAVFRLRFMRERYIVTQAGIDCTEFWRAADTPEQRYLRWLVQGDFSRRLIADVHAVRVEAQPAQQRGCQLM